MLLKKQITFIWLQNASICATSMFKPRISNNSCTAHPSHLQLLKAFLIEAFKRFLFKTTFLAEHIIFRKRRKRIFAGKTGQSLLHTQRISGTGQSLLHAQRISGTGQSLLHTQRISGFLLDLLVPWLCCCQSGIKQDKERENRERMIDWLIKLQSYWIVSEHW